MSSISAPVDPTRSAAPTDQTGSDTGWATATGTVVLRRPEPIDTNGRALDPSFIEEQGTPSPAIL